MAWVRSPFLKKIGFHRAQYVCGKYLNTFPNQFSCLVVFSSWQWPESYSRLALSSEHLKTSEVLQIRIPSHSSRIHKSEFATQGHLEWTSAFKWILLPWYSALESNFWSCSSHPATWYSRFFDSSIYLSEAWSVLKKNLLPYRYFWEVQLPSHDGKLFSPCDVAIPHCFEQCLAGVVDAVFLTLLDQGQNSSNPQRCYSIVGAYFCNKFRTTTPMRRPRGPHT